MKHKTDQEVDRNIVAIISGLYKHAQRKETAQLIKDLINYDVDTTEDTEEHQKKDVFNSY